MSELVDEFGTKFWYLNEKLHREDGPAVEYASGAKYWFINGQRHREDGPAAEFSDGSKSWWYHGKRIDCSSNEEFLRIVKMRAFW